MPASCYLLRCTTEPRRAYIGYALNPHNRLAQHNGGTSRGGSRQTHGRTWQLVTIVTGFPTARDALGFEYAWQHPRAQPLWHILWRRRLQHMAGSFSRLAATARRVPRSTSAVEDAGNMLAVVLRMAPWRGMRLQVKSLTSGGGGAHAASGALDCSSPAPAPGAGPPPRATAAAAASTPDDAVECVEDGAIFLSG